MKTLIKKKKGFSLLELLLVLGIVAALIVSAFLIYPKAQSSQRAAAEAKNLATIQAGVKSLYGGIASYSGLTNATALGAKVFPDVMISGTGTSADVVNSFKGSVTVAPDNTGPSGVAGSSFTITYTGVPNNECTKIIATTAESFYMASVGSTVVKDAGGQLNIVNASTACNSNNNSNTLVLTSL